MLATQVLGSNDTDEVITSGSGFDIVDDAGDTGPSTVTAYDPAGHRLAVISGSFDGDCGAADVVVPGTGRLIITELTTQQAAAGVAGPTYSTQLTARSAASGATVWTASMVRSAAGSSPSCGSATSSEDLSGFGTTNDGRWGLFADGTDTPRIVNLSTGASRADANVAGTLGSYVVDACLPNNDAGALLVNTITDPAAGSASPDQGAGVGTPGQFLTEGSAPNASNFCKTPASSSAPTLDFFSSNTLEFALPGLYLTNSSGTSPSSGLSSDGTGLMVDYDPSGNYSMVEMVRYALPSLKQVWQKQGNYYMWGDAAGVLVASPVSGSANPPLLGINDQTGTQEWSTPITGTSGNVCAMTSTQILYAVNGELAVLSLKTGKQLSYQSNPDAGGNECPQILPGGISQNTDSSTVTVTQTLAP